MHVLNGHRPDRPAVGFSDALWKLLEKSWRGEHKRPHIFTLRAQLGKDGGISGAAVIVGSCLFILEVETLRFTFVSSRWAIIPG